MMNVENWSWYGSQWNNLLHEFVYFPLYGTWSRNLARTPYLGRLNQCSQYRSALLWTQYNSLFRLGKRRSRKLHSSKEIFLKLLGRNCLTRICSTSSRYGRFSRSELSQGEGKLHSSYGLAYPHNTILSELATGRWSAKIWPYNRIHPRQGSTNCYFQSSRCPSLLSHVDQQFAGLLQSVWDPIS